MILSDKTFSLPDQPLFSQSANACILYTSGSTGQPKGVCIGHEGLTEFLSGDTVELKELIYPSGYNENCEFIYSGSIPPNPSDLLQNGKLDELLEMIKKQNKYKYIVIDTAPLLLVTDSFLLADKSDVIVYVTRSEITEKSYLEFLNHSIKDKKLKNVGIIINGIQESNFGYGNKYGYGYTAEDKRWWRKFFRI